MTNDLPSPAFVYSCQKWYEEGQVAWRFQKHTFEYRPSAYILRCFRDDEWNSFTAFVKSTLYWECIVYD